MTVAHLNDELVSDLHCPTGGGLHIEVFDTLIRKSAQLLAMPEL
jgi:hypothetical protein